MLSIINITTIIKVNIIPYNIANGGISDSIPKTLCLGYNFSFLSQMANKKFNTKIKIISNILFFKFSFIIQMYE